MLFLDLLPVIGPWRIRRDAERFARWQAFLQTGNFGAQIFQIIGIRQQARTGLKAYGRWLFTGQTCALWIEGAWPGVGAFMSANGTYGDGPHHGEYVFYAKQPYYFMDRASYLGMQRHVARQNKAAMSNAV